MLSTSLQPDLVILADQLGRDSDEGSHAPLKRERSQIVTESRHHRSVGEQTNPSACKAESSRTPLVQIQSLRPVSPLVMLRLGHVAKPGKAGACKAPTAGSNPVMSSICP